MRLAVEQGDPHAGHRVAGQHALLHLPADALLHRRDELPRHHAADDLVDELEAGGVRQRLDLDVADAVLAVPAGLLDVTAQALGLARRSSRAAAPAGSIVSTATPYRLASRSSSTSACASPMDHSTSWRVSALFSSRSVGSSATSRPRACDSLSSSALDLATMATGSSGSGIDHGSISSGWSLSDSVSPVSARAELGHRADVAGPALRHRPLLLAQRRGQRADPLVVVVVVVPAGRAAVAGHVHGGVGPQRARRTPGPG